MARGGQEIKSSYGSLINHYFRNSLPLNQFNTAHSFISYLKLHFNITVACHLRLSLFSGPFSLDSHAEILSVFSVIIVRSQLGEEMKRNQVMEGL
jgi:hypothetical protein